MDFHREQIARCSGLNIIGVLEDAIRFYDYWLEANIRVVE
jgi:hypothetical protein